MSRKAETTAPAWLLAGGLAWLALQPGCHACSRSTPVSAEEMLQASHFVVRAVAARYERPPLGVARTTGIAPSTIRFKVLEVLKGRGLPNPLVIRGYLDTKDDFNDRPAPYDFVRPGGRSGSCYANTYKQGAQYLLFLQWRQPAAQPAGAPPGPFAGDRAPVTPYWYPLGPVNEQLRSAGDPWLLWAREQLSRRGTGSARANKTQGLRLHISGPSRVRPGDGSLRFSAAITNGSKAPVTLVLPGDGSDVGWRTPVIRWLVTPVGALRELPPEPVARCGNVNPVTPEEVVVLEPGASKELGAWVGQPRLPGPGAYKVVLLYENSPRLEWKGISDHDPAILERVRASTPCALSSNVLEVRVAGS